MLHFESSAEQFLFYLIAGVSTVVLLTLGYLIGSAIATSRYRQQIARNEKDLFTAQTGFKKLYENEIGSLQSDKARLAAENETLLKRTEDYRRKAAGFGGLFTSGGKKADAMYALLLENEALEEALHKQNTKLNQERTDAVQESLRNIGYRRVLMSQLLNDSRIKEYVREIIDDDGLLPSPRSAEQAKLPAAE